jgi:hypothetical protein
MGGMVSSRVVPQAAQACAPGGTSAPQSGHTRPNACPHDWQKAASGGLTWPQAGHSIDAKSHSGWPWPRRGYQLDAVSGISKPPERNSWFTSPLPAGRAGGHTTPHSNLRLWPQPAPAPVHFEPYPTNLNTPRQTGQGLSTQLQEVPAPRSCHVPLRCNYVPALRVPAGHLGAILLYGHPLTGA